MNRMLVLIPALKSARPPRHPAASRCTPAPRRAATTP